MQAGAELSDDCGYRLRAWRIWNAAEKPVAFVMLMPHIREEFTGNAHITRCCEIASVRGAGGAVMVYLFGLRAWRFGEVVRSIDDPVGPETDAAILDAVRESSAVVCVWGRSGDHAGRGDAVLTLLRNAGARPLAAGLLPNGRPAGPGRPGSAVRLVEVVT